MKKDKEWKFLGLVPAFSSPSSQMQALDCGNEADGFSSNGSLAHIRMQEGSYRKFNPAEISGFLEIAEAHPDQKAHQIRALQAAARAMGLNLA